MGKLFSGSTTTKNTSNPWGPQGDALKGIFTSAGDIYNKAANTPFYGGPLYATLDGQTQDATNQVGNFVNGSGAGNAASISDAGRGILARFGGSPNALDNLMAQATMDPTSINIRNATEYAMNPATDGMIDAASRDVTRNLAENELPTINRAATATGNVNSTRAGVASAVASRGAADRIADISSTIRGEQFNRGLELSERARTSNMSGLVNAGQLGNQGMGLGIDAITSGNNMSLGNLDALIRSGQIRQGDAQGQMDADYKRWQGNDTRSMDLLSRYYGIVGDKSWGGTSTSKQKSTPSILGAVGGLASLAGGFGVI